MQSVDSASQPLLPEAALASRLLFAPQLPTAPLKWLAAPRSVPAASRPPSELQQVLDEIFTPLQSLASKWQKREVESASEWFAQTLEILDSQDLAQDRAFKSRLILSCLLPIYRGLSASSLTECMEQSRFRLSEAWVVGGLSLEFGADLTSVLERCERLNHSPEEVLEEQLQIDLSTLTQLTLAAWQNFDPDGSEISSETKLLLLSADPKDYSDFTPEWAKLSVLWRIANDLVEGLPEMVLPRSWIDVDVQWELVVEHWERIDAILHKAAGEMGGSSQPAGIAGGEVESSSEDAAEEQTDPAGEDGLPRDEQVQAGLLRDEQEKGVRIDSGTVVSDEGSTQPTRASHLSCVDGGSSEEPVIAVDPPIGTPEVIAHVQNTIATLKELADLNAEELDGPLDGRRADSMSAPSRPDPKLIISEIRSHNDPIFVSVIQRQIALCHNEDRSISLASIVVTPENAADQCDACRLLENGLAIWQQRLARWVVDHPSVIQPKLFRSTEGELILCLLDIERSECTAMLRQGLMEILTGKRLDSTAGTLARVPVPAKFHVGISTKSCPGRAFSPEQIIAPCRTCLDAAKQFGSASIKSIEVY
ncbi:hypothetical protein [Aureliella helgolandensis]|uniref:Uncharacterized protein n=1 Tax=Aureliella helgolandensis TaxID=2527968 RepID=A0A518G5N4_9BACT|nr:hypothetical protein [Aureliella helgolandensis]QDV23879.1 hypothetical protein Q31a_21880 [Aureliella helgolandensis]